MKPARLLVLLVAVVAGLGAAYMLMTSKEPPPPAPVAYVPPKIVKDNVLVAKTDLPNGAALSDANMAWKPYDRDSLPQNAIVQAREPNAMNELKGMVVVSEVMAGDPLRRERLAKDDFMATRLPSGTRAVAIDLADQGKSAAGGFILPNDRVDVIRIFHPDDSPGAFASETILTNVRVLAVGQAVQDKAGERTVIGGTATLELTPEQAEKVVLAQRTGQLTLTLRSVADATKLDKTADAPQTMTIIRFGNASQSRVH